jgi:hypothetical protein
MRPAIGAGVLWAQRICLVLAATLVLALAVAVAVWLLVVDWQIIAG